MSSSVSDAAYVDTPSPEDEASDSDALFERLKTWVSGDREAQRDWLEEAKEDFDFVASHQWDDETRRLLRLEGRPPTTFNLVGAMIQSVSGYEISNRQETAFLPRHVGVAGQDELVTGAYKYFRANADAEYAESAAFLSATVCGYGFTETFIDYDDNPDGDYRKLPVHYREIVFDRNARQRNLKDGRRIARIREMSCLEAEELFPDVERSELHAAWIDDEDDGDRKSSGNDPRNRYNGQASHEWTDEKRVKIVDVQWYEFERFARFIDPFTGAEAEMSLDKFKILEQRAAEFGVKLTVAKQRRKVYKRAFLGTKLLEPVSELPAGKHFTYGAVTGLLDENKGTFYGLVRALKDPQRWTNKLFSQTMHILNTNAKGGIVAERGAFEDDNKAAQDWAKADSIVWAKTGTLSGQSPAFIPKPVAQLPPAFFQLMDFALNMGPRVSGINLEFLGMREANQAGVLEYQRRQAGITILAPLFDSLRLHRIMCGRMDLVLIQRYLSDGRLVRIVGPDVARFMPLNRDATLGEYEIVVDDAPTSPNQQEKTWAITMQMKDLLGPLFAQNPELAAKFIKHSPLPESASSDIAAALTKPNPMQGEQAAAAKAAAFAKINRDDAAAEKDKATALKTLSEVLAPPLIPLAAIDGPFPVMPPGPPMPPPGMMPGMGPGMPPMGPAGAPPLPMPPGPMMPQGAPPMPAEIPPGL